MQVILKADIKRTQVMEEIQKLESKKKLEQVLVLILENDEHISVISLSFYNFIT